MNRFGRSTIHHSDLAAAIVPSVSPGDPRVDLDRDPTVHPVGGVEHGPQDVGAPPHVEGGRSRKTPRRLVPARGRARRSCSA